MPTPTMMGFGNTPQTPQNAAGVYGERPFEAVASFQTASGGSVGIGRIVPSGGVATGIPCIGAFPGFAATLIGTGLYNITHPPAKNAFIFPTVAVPSGFSITPNFVYKRGDSVTGIAQLQLTGPQSGNATGTVGPVNPPTGTRIDLLFYVSPQNSPGLTKF